MWPCQELPLKSGRQDQGVMAMKLLYITSGSRTGASQSDGLVSYTEHTLVRCLTLQLRCSRCTQKYPSPTADWDPWSLFSQPLFKRSTSMPSKQGTLLLLIRLIANSISSTVVMISHRGKSYMLSLPTIEGLWERFRKGIYHLYKTFIIINVIIKSCQ